MKSTVFILVTFLLAFSGNVRGNHLLPSKPLNLENDGYDNSAAIVFRDLNSIRTNYKKVIQAFMHCWSVSDTVEPVSGDLILNEVNSTISFGATYVEIYNTTENTICLDRVILEHYSNGNNYPNDVLSMFGYIAANSYVVISRSNYYFSQEYGFSCDFSLPYMELNGNADGLLLKHIDNGNIDMFNNVPSATESWEDNTLFYRFNIDSDGSDIENDWDNAGLNMQGTPKAKNEITWQTDGTSNWSDPGNWDNGDYPTKGVDCIIPSGGIQPVITDVRWYSSNCKNLTIQSGAILTIPSGKGLTVFGDIFNEDYNSLVIEMDTIETGSLLHYSDGCKGTLKQYIKSDNSWHFVSVPYSDDLPGICDGNYAPTVDNFNQHNGQTYDFYYLDETVAENNWINIKATGWGVNTSGYGVLPSFSCGRGYLVAYNNDFIGSPLKSSCGVFSNGAINIPVTADNINFNLVGNPYPSFIDWKAAGWDRSNLVNNNGFDLWVWNETLGVFGVYNTSLSGFYGTNGASRVISPGAGFYVEASNNGSLGLNNDIRTHYNVPPQKASEAFNSFSLSVTNDQNSYKDEIIIEFGHANNNAGTKKINSFYSTAPSLYTKCDSKRLSVDLRTNIDDNPSIPVSFIAGADGVYTIKAERSDFETIILEDVAMNIKIDLNTNPWYSFSAFITDDPDRFIIHFNTVGNEDVNEESNLNLFFSGSYVTFINNNNSIGDIYILNMSGQVIESFELNGSSNQKMLFNYPSGMYVIKAITTDGSFITKKIINIK